MTGYILRRLLQFIPVFLGTTFVVFFLAWGMPGDPLAGKCGDRECPDAFVAAATEEFKLDRPLIVRYGYYLADLGRGDLGRSFTGRDVSEQLVAAFPATVRLALLAVLIEVLLGITIVGAVTVVVVAYLFINLLVDLSYAVLAPRIRYD